VSLLLYNAPQSTCSQRVRFVLHAKSIAFSERRLDLFAGDQLRPEYLELNPNGVVPTLVHDGDVITDSSVIMEYLEEMFGRAPRFMPEDPAERAAMRSLMRFIDEVPTPAIRVPSYQTAFLRHFQSMSEAEFLALAEAKPLRKDFLLRMGRTGFPAAEVEKALEQLGRGLHRMSDAIGRHGGPWLLNDLTLADVAIMPVLIRMEDIGMASFWHDMPEIERWLELIKQQPAFAPTFCPGTLLSEKYPDLGLPGIARPGGSQPEFEEVHHGIDRAERTT
jgi:glutathione S-transferase